MTNITISTIMKALNAWRNVAYETIGDPTTAVEAKEAATKDLKSIDEALLDLKKTTPVKVSVMVSGGVVQSAVSNDSTAVVDVYDLDESSHSSPEEQEELRVKQEDWDKLCESPDTFGVF